MPGLVLAACVAFAGFALAQSAEPVSPKLTPKLQDLLRKEMLSVNEASQEILAAMVTGDDERVATLAQQIHDSFILRQSMTPEDKADLMAAVPETSSGWIEIFTKFQQHWRRQQMPKTGLPNGSVLAR